METTMNYSNARMLSILCVRLTIKVKVGMPESFKVGWYPPPQKETGSSHLEKRGFQFRSYCSEFSLMFMLF